MRTVGGAAGFEERGVVAFVGAAGFVAGPAGDFAGGGEGGAGYRCGEDGGGVCEGDEGEVDHGEGVGEVHFGVFGRGVWRELMGFGRFGRRMVEVGSMVNVGRGGGQSNKVVTDDGRCCGC